MTSADASAPVRVCGLADLPVGEALRVAWTDPPIAVFHTDDGDVLAIDDTCTHQDASLADGWLEGCEVECPLHASRFDLRTGEVDAAARQGRRPGPPRQVVDGEVVDHLVERTAPAATRRDDVTGR